MPKKKSRKEEKKISSYRLKWLFSLIKQKVVIKMNLRGKRALVTGASRGIGRAIAIELASCGASVAICYSKDDRGAEDTVNTIREMGAYGKAFKCDISKYKEAECLVEEVVKTLGGIDILVNNAGISKVGLFIDMKEDDWDSIININLKGMFNVTHNAVKHMLNSKCGSIVNISSIWGNSGASCEVIYSTSKGGVNSFTKALAKELAPSNIRVNAVSPGVIDTGMNSWLQQEEVEALKEEIPMGCFGEPEDVAKLVSFLSSSEAKYITGQIMTVDGGLL
jgi:3-oxoacyl-[acyl-carrier protein] reductase